MKINSFLKKDLCQHKDGSNRIKIIINKAEDINEFKEQKTKKAKFQPDVENKGALNLKRKEQFKKSFLKSLKSFNENDNSLNFWSNKKIEKLNQSNFLMGDMEYPKSSHNIKTNLYDKNFSNIKNTAYNASLVPLHDINKYLNNKEKLNKKNNFLQLINPNNKNKLSKFSVITKNNIVGDSEGESLNLIQKNIQNRLMTMGKESEFLEFEKTPLEMSINRLLLKNNKQLFSKKRTKKIEDKKKGINFFKKHKTINNWKTFNKLESSNLTTSNFEDWPYDKSEINFSKFNKSNFGNSKPINNFNYNKINSKRNNIKDNHKNNISNNYDIVDLVKSEIKGGQSSINNLLKSSHSYKSSIINESNISSSSKRQSKEGNNSIENNIDIDIPMFKRRNGFFINMDKYRTLSQKKLVYDSLDDEENIEDAVTDNFYFHPDDKIVLIIDSLILFLTIYCMAYKPLKLVLNNCDIKDTFTSLSFGNILNLFIDFIFICDLIINCFKAYYNFEEQLVTRSEKIIFNYMKNYFIIDFISAIPYYSIIKLIAKENHKTLNNTISCSKYYNHEINDIYQILELLKLIKMIKCISKENKVTNIITNKLNRIPFIESRSILLNSIFMAILILNLTACVHIFISCTAFPNWIIYKNLDTSPFIIIYFTSIYFLITTVTSVGYGDITGNSINEFIFQIILLIIGIIAYSWLISAISNYVKEKNEQNDLFNQKIAILDEIKFEHPKLTKDLYDKIYLHLEYINLKHKKDKSSLLDSLPNSVHKPLLYEMYKPIIENFIFFKNFKNSDFINRVISKLKPVLAIKNDLLVEQGEIIEDTIFVKQGRLSLEVKIDSDHPEKSVEKLLNEEYFFGIENNEIYQKRAFGGVLSMPKINQNQTVINKKNLFNLYSGNNIDDNNVSLKTIKSIIINEKNEAEIQRHRVINNNYIHLRILDIRKNEHFGALLMFLNKRSPLTLRVKSNKAELFFLKKLDAIEISNSYPNIWKRVNKKSFHNLKQIKKIMKKIIQHFCESYGINYDFASKIYESNLNELERVRTKKVLEQNIQLLNKYNLLNQINNAAKRPSVDVLNSKFKTFHNFPKRASKFLIKSNVEKDEDELISKSFERSSYLNKNIVVNIKQNNTENYSSLSSSLSNKGSSGEKNKNKKIDNPIDYVEKNKPKVSFLDFRFKKDKKTHTDNEIQKINSKEVKLKNDLVGETNNSKEIKENNREKYSNNISNKKIIKYGDEETNNLIKSFGTPYYPEDVNDEVYPGEIFEISSQKLLPSIKYEHEYSRDKNCILNYSDFSRKNKKLFSQASSNEFDLRKGINNFTIQNNYITKYSIKNLNVKKCNENLSIFKFSLNYLNSEINFQKKKVSNYTIFKQSFEIPSGKNLENSDIKENYSVKLYNNGKKINKSINNDVNIKKSNLKSDKIVHHNKNFNEEVIDNSNTKKENINGGKDIKILNKKDNISHNSSRSLSFDDSNSSNQSKKNNNNKNENIFICKPQIKRQRNSICFFKRGRKGNKNDNNKFQICKNIIIKLSAYYDNLNMITNGKISKIKKFQVYFKKIISNKLLKNKEKEENFNSQNLQNSNIKYIRPKSMAKKITTKIGKNNLYKITHAEKKLKITDVKNTLQKPLNSQVQDKKYATKTKKSNIINIDDLNDSSLNSSSNNFIARRGKTKKKNNDNEFLLDYVNRNIKDDNAVLNNPGRFFNGLFNGIMKNNYNKNK